MKQLLDDLPFEISARVPIQLGRESISNSTVAISELIKNSYDADAESVSIQFVTSSDGLNCMIIDDDGMGMDYQLITENWLKIGTDFKNTNPYSQVKKRILTGAKGLGRLGVDRLCSRLRLLTRTDSMNHFIELVVDWNKYETTDLPLSQITHSIYKVDFDSEDEFDSFIEKDSSGTRLILEGLKDEWDLNHLNKLKKELSLLVSPFGDTQNDFSIHLDTGYTPIDGYLTSNHFLELAPWKIHAKISEDNNVSITQYNTQTDAEFVEKDIPWVEWIKTRSDKPKCGPVEIKLFYLPETKDVKEKAKSLNFLLKDLKSFMHSNYGVRIYRDSFRVRPYGEPSGKGDWLNLGIRKSASPGGIVQGGWRVGPRQLVGAVFISRLENGGLYDQANREGLLEGDEFYDLRAFVLTVIERFEWNASQIARMSAKGESLDEIKSLINDRFEKSKTSTDNIVHQIKMDLEQRFPSAKKNRSKKEKKEKQKEKRKADIIINKISELQKDLNEAQKNFDLATAKTESLEQEKDTLQNLASLGILSVSFGHEIKEFSNIAATRAVQLARDFKKKETDLAKVNKDWWGRSLVAIQKNTEFVRDFATFALENVKPYKRRKKEILIPDILQRVIGAMQASLDRQEITIDTQGLPIDLKPIPGFEIDWESIFVNLITNSIWAITEAQPKERLIKVEGKQKEEIIEISFMDSGVGLENGTEEMIFSPMYSTRKDREGIPEGTGMGLAIVSSFIKNHNKGEIKAKATSPLGGAQFIITLNLNK